MMTLRNKKLPRFRFEYDPLRRTIYFVDEQKPTALQRGEVLFDECDSPKMARLVVTCWCGGYLNKEREQFDPKAKQHHRLLAETGFIPIIGSSIGGRVG